VAGVAPVVVVAAGAEWVGIRGAVSSEGGGVAALAPGIEGLALGGGTDPRAAVPGAGVKHIRGAKVVFEESGESDLLADEAGELGAEKGERFLTTNFTTSTDKRKTGVVRAL
jgi:hypothetical protein